MTAKRVEPDPDMAAARTSGWSSQPLLHRRQHKEFLKDGTLKRIEDSCPAKILLILGIGRGASAKRPMPCRPMGFRRRRAV